MPRTTIKIVCFLSFLARMEHKFCEPVKVENVKEEEGDSNDSDSSDYDMFEKTCESCGHVDRYEEF